MYDATGSANGLMVDLLELDKNEKPVKQQQKIPTFTKAFFLTSNIF